MNFSKLGKEALDCLFFWFLLCNCGGRLGGGYIGLSEPLGSGISKKVRELREVGELCLWRVPGGDVGRGADLPDVLPEF